MGASASKDEDLESDSFSEVDGDDCGDEDLMPRNEELEEAILSEFVEGAPWCHLDIAGSAFLDGGHKHMAPGGTGSMVPTLARWIAQK